MCLGPYRYQQSVPGPAPWDFLLAVPESTCMTGIRRRRFKRRGVYTIELIMVMIVLVLATFVSFQFGIFLIVKQAVAHAATVAAREAAKANPATIPELEQIIETVLAGHQIV